jgi:hypothetical protein
MILPFRGLSPLLTLGSCLLLVLLGYFSLSRLAPLSTFGNDLLSLSEQEEPRILLVSAYYPLKKSKHSFEDYEKWFEHFLRPITTDIYFFCPPDTEPLIRSLRGNKSIIIDTSFPSLYDIPPLHGLEDKYQEMHAWDKEKSYHSPELYAVWNAKPYFLWYGLAAAAAANGVKYDYAFWSDAGSMRDPHTYTEWPDPGRVTDVFSEASRKSGVSEDELIFFPWWWTPKPDFKTWKEADGPIDDTIAEG